MFSPERFQLFLTHKKLTNTTTSIALGVSPATIDRYRNGYVAPGQSMCLLMQRTWPEWWPFLTKQTNELPEV